MKRLWLFLLIGLGLLGGAWSTFSAEKEIAKAAPATYTGSEVCQACHAASFEKFGQTQMGKIFLFNARNEHERRSCENCHGPGSNHVAAGGGKGVGNLITFRKNAGESAETQNAPCLSCHERGAQTYWKASTHANRGVACVNCHTLMEKTSGKQMTKLTQVTPFGIQRAEIEVCGQCHLQRKAQLMRSSHMPMREGKIVCSDCHNPHGTPNPSLLRQNSVNENCYTCHAERRGPFLWEHPPVLENCSNCHEPHGSVNDRLLKTTDPRLCTQCHIHTRHPATPRPLRQQSPTIGPSVFAYNRSCTNCHNQMHGSNHPAGKFYQR